MFSASKYIYLMWLQTSPSSYGERMLSTSAMQGFIVHTTLLTEIQKLSSLTIPRIGLWSAHGQSKQNSEWPWIKATDVHSHGATWHLILVCFYRTETGLIADASTKTPTPPFVLYLAQTVHTYACRNPPAETWHISILSSVYLDILFFDKYSVGRNCPTNKTGLGGHLTICTQTPHYLVNTPLTP